MSDLDDIEFIVLIASLALTQVIGIYWKYRFFDKQPYYTDDTSGNKYTSDIVNHENWNQMADR